MAESGLTSELFGSLDLAEKQKNMFTQVKHTASPGSQFKMNPEFYEGRSTGSTPSLPELSNKNAMYES